MKIPLAAAMAALSPTVFDAEVAPAELRVSSDTRTIEPGDTFLALRGERCDGHDYTNDAVRRGASLLIVEDSHARVAGTATMLVPSTLRAYLELAGVARERFAGRVVAITGSAGKTTTKAFLAQLLSARYGGHAIAAPGNENNEIGVSKLLLSATNEDHDAIVVEMGARRAGDIATLVACAKPHVGILTNVGDAHVEIMGSRERLAETKWALFSHGARAVLNADDAVSLERAATLAGRPHWFAARDRGWDVDPHSRTTLLLGRNRLIDADRDRVTEVAVDVNVPGAHNLANLAAAVAGALELGVELESIIATIPRLQMPAGRFESFAMPGGWRIIFDAYNANASGMIAALDAFVMEQAKRTIAVLGSMAELGDESEQLHERVGAHAAARVDVLLVAGEFSDALARGARKAGFEQRLLATVASNAEAADWLQANARPGDVVLLKASRKYRLEEIIERLQAVAQR